MSLKKPKKPKEDPSATAMRERQILDLSKLDEEENRRVKSMMMATRGTTMFRGSPALRGAPSNTKGAAPRTGSAAPGAAPGRGLVTPGARGRSLLDR